MLYQAESLTTWAPTELVCSRQLDMTPIGLCMLAVLLLRACSSTRSHVEGRVPRAPCDASSCAVHCSSTIFLPKA